MKRRLAFTLSLAFALSSLETAAHAQQPPAATSDAKESSRMAFKKGVSQLRAQDWTGARASFEAAWSLFPHPSILLNLGISRLRTDEPVLAEADFVRFLSEDFGAAPEELASARELLSEARNSIGTLKIAVIQPTASVMVDGKVVRLAKITDGLAADLHVKAGAHVVVASAPGFDRFEHEFSVGAKAEEAVPIDLQAQLTGPVVIEHGTPVRQIVGYCFAGVGGAALLTGGVLAIRAKLLADDYNGSYPKNPDVRSQGIAFRTGADVAFGVAILAGAAVVILFVTDTGRARIGKTARLVLNDPTLFRW